MADLLFTRSGELMVTQVEGNTEAGIEFVDEWCEGEFVVVDAGRIIVPGSGVEAITGEAVLRGLSIEEDIVEAEKGGKR